MRHMHIRCAGRHPVILVAVLLFTACPLLAGAGEGPTFQGLGYFDGEHPASRAAGVSADGSVVVGSSTGRPFRWHDGKMEDLGALPGGNGQGGANAVSLDGSVVVGLSNSANGNQEAFRWHNGKMEALGDLEGGGFNSNAYATSAPGFVVVGQGVSDNGIEAFRWQNGEMTGLGDLEGGEFNSTAYGISTDASVIVGRGRSEAGVEAFRWTLGGGMQGLGDAQGDVFPNAAYATSFNGAVIVGGGDSENGSEAFRWEAGKIVGLGSLPGGGFYSVARAVSGNGAVIVGESTVDDGTRAFIWTEKDGIRDIQQLLEDHGFDLDGWTLGGATAISSNGTVVVGYGNNPQGRPEAWRATGLDQLGTAEPEFSLDPDALDFGEVGTGNTSAPQTAVLHNTGDGDATGIVFSEPGQEFFVDTEDCGDTLPAGASCELTVTFSPAEPGAAAGILQVQSEEGAVADLDLSGQGVELPEEIFLDRFEDGHSQSAKINTDASQSKSGKRRSES